MRGDRKKSIQKKNVPLKSHGVVHVREAATALGWEGSQIFIFLRRVRVAIFVFCFSDIVGALVGVGVLLVDCISLDSTHVRDVAVPV